MKPPHFVLAFIIFSISCYTTRVKEVRTAADWKGKKVKILSVVKTSGERIEFHKDSPGRIYGDNIIGVARVERKEMEVDRANIKGRKVDTKGKILEITTRDGKIYQFISGTVRQEEDKIIISYEYESVSIPLSEVKEIQIEKSYVFKALLALSTPYLFYAGAMFFIWIIIRAGVTSY